MKKINRLLPLLLALFLLVSCGETETGTVEQGNGAPTVLNSAEYVLYQNVFYNDQTAGILNKEWTKKGTFAKIEDRYYNCTRYYVWGYNDATHCCDWQWEFVPKEGTALPPVGSLIEMTGVFLQTDKALDGFRFENAAVSVVTRYTGAAKDFDLTCMSDTLERVQLLNLQAHPADFEGKTVTAYGRILSAGTLQDPYYDSSWTQAFTSDAALASSVGKTVKICGVCKNGTLTDCTVEEYAA